jgi:YesN/AraC family two-component response regulator
VVLDEFIPNIVYLMFEKCNPGWRIQPKTVEDHDLTYIIKGNARFTVNNTVHELEAGDLLYLNEGDLIEAATTLQNPMQCFTVNFKTKYQKAKDMDRGGSLFPMTSRIGLRQDLISLFKELTISWTEQQAGYIMKTRALLMLIINRLSELLLYDTEPVSGDFRVNKIIRYISAHYRKRLAVKELAAHVNITPDYFGFLFKRETGMHVNQYITKIRIHNAEDLLRTGKYKVSEVSDYCGFSDVVHFYRSFRAIRGCAPSRCIPKNAG